MIPIAKPSLGIEEKNAVIQVLDSGNLACGIKTEEFEKKFAEYVGTKYAVATSSGTTALHLALIALNITNEDEVIIPDFTFIATANIVLFCNATPVLCDINYKTFNIEPEKIEKLISNKTKAIIPVHLYGLPADIKTIQEIADKHNLYVIGDACQAHGATNNGKMVGSFGDLECFSFYPTKNMTTGEGGMITTNNSETAEILLSLRNHGREKNGLGYSHNHLGYNYRMTDINAAIGIEQLKKLPTRNILRQKNANLYNILLENVETPYIPSNLKHVYHQYTIKTRKRDTIIQNLKNNQIGYGIYYPQPLHKYNHLKKYMHKNLQISEKLSEEVLSIPVHPDLTIKDIEKTIKTINEVAK